MKKLLFFLALVCCYGCSDNTVTEMNEGNAQQLYNTIKGTYMGNIMVNNIPQKTYLTIDNNLTVKYLPVRPILERIFTDAALDEAEKSAGSVVFTASIDQMAVTGGNAYLKPEPTDLVFTVKVGSKSYTVNALMEGVLYANTTYNELSMTMNVTQLNCDGIQYDMVNQGVNYYVDNAKKE